MALLGDFGRPAQVAARYQPRNPLIDPEDNHNFAIWAVVGFLALAVLSGGSKPDLLGWLGLLFVVFACIAWFRRRQPGGTFNWKPRVQDKALHGGRWPALLSAAGLVVCGDTGVAHLATSIRFIIDSTAVFGDVDRGQPIVALQSEQQVAKAARRNLPSHIGDGCAARSGRPRRCRG